MDSQELAPLKSDDFRTTTFLAVSADAARARDGNPFCVFGPDQGMMKKACFMVGGVLEVQLLVSIKVGLVLARQQSGSMVQMESDSALEMNAAAEECAGWEQDRAAALPMASVNGCLDGRSIF